jgi:hypothetical protein
MLTRMDLWSLLEPAAGVLVVMVGARRMDGSRDSATKSESAFPALLPLRVLSHTVTPRFGKRVVTRNANFVGGDLAADRKIQ